MNTKRILLSLASVTLLASCGGNNSDRPAGDEIQKDAAISRFESINNKVSKGEVEIPEKYTISTTMDLGVAGYKAESSVAVDPSQNYTHLKVTSEGTDDQSRDYTTKDEWWIFQQDENTFIIAEDSTNPERSDKKYMELSAEVFPNYKASIEQIVSQYSLKLSSIYTEFVRNFQSLLTTDYGAMVGASSEGVTVDRLNISDKYYTTGEGNLSFVLDIDMAAHDSEHSAAVKGGAKVTIDAYLPQLLSISYDMTADGESLHNTTEMKFSWNQVSVEKPDLSDFRKVA